MYDARKSYVTNLSIVGGCVEGLESWRVETITKLLGEYRTYINNI